MPSDQPLPPLDPNPSPPTFSVLAKKPSTTTAQPSHLSGVLTPDSGFTVRGGGERRSSPSEAGTLPAQNSRGSSLWLVTEYILMKPESTWAERRMWQWVRLLISVGRPSALQSFQCGAAMQPYSCLDQAASGLLPRPRRAVQPARAASRAACSCRPLTPLSPDAPPQSGCPPGT